MTDLILSCSIESLVAARDAHRQAVIDAFDAIEHAVTLGGEGTFRERSGAVWRPEREASLLEVDRIAWEGLVTRTGVVAVMDTRSRESWAKALREGSFPPFEAAHIEATLHTLATSVPDFFGRSIEDVFRSLSWDYQTNSPCKFGKRIILAHVLDSRFNRAHPYVEHQSMSRLDDLVRAFRMIEKLPPLEHRHECYAVIAPQIRDGVRKIETEYFSLRWFYKGTAHVTFKRPDLVDEMNKIIAKRHPNVLPPRERD